MTDHDLLIRLCEKMDSMNLLLTNHLHHHFLYNMALFTALLSVIGGFVLYWSKGREKLTRKR